MNARLTHPDPAVRELIEKARTEGYDQGWADGGTWMALTTARLREETRMNGRVIT